MPVICPTVTADNPHTYREQMERVAEFAHRIHIDFSDGIFSPVRLINPIHAWWPDGIDVDIHAMFKAPAEHIETLISLHPNLVIIHAESDDVVTCIQQLKEVGIKTGLAILQTTTISSVGHLLRSVDHALIFSGNLGHFGGTANMALLDKVESLKRAYPHIEIGWDGGINDENIPALVRSGVDILNVGGFIQRADSPSNAYAKLEERIEGSLNEKKNDR